MIVEHPYVACLLSMFIGILVGCTICFVLPDLIADTAADDHGDITGIGA